MRYLIKTLKIGDSILTEIIKLMAVLLLIYAAIGLGNIVRINNGAKNSTAIMEFKPTESTSQEEIKLSFEQLRKINPDIIAWITIPGTHIDYPVAQGTDNMAYINTAADGSYSISGSIFLDSQNALTDRYLLLYGHHMDSGAMFGDLPKYLEDAYTEKHSTGYFITEDEKKKFKVFAAGSYNAFDIEIFDAHNINNKSDILEYIQSTATIYDSSANIDGIDRKQIIALATCSSSATDARTVVFAVVE